MATMKDIAREVGVTEATVSYILNGKQKERHISDDTTQKVRQAAARLQYRADELARAVSTGRSRTIGFVSQPLMHEFMAAALEGVMRGASAREYHIRLVDYASHSSADALHDEVCGHKLSGLVFYNFDSAQVEDLEFRLRGKNVPLGFVSGVSGVPENCVSVGSDDMAGGRLAAEHLLGLGHTRMAFLAGWSSGRPFAVARRKGFEEALEGRGLSLIPECVMESRVEQADAVDFVEKMTGLGAGAPTAYFCVSDLLAVETMFLLLSKGIRVPDDVSVMGYSDMNLCGFAHPALTSVAERHDEVGERLVAKLIRKIEHPRAQIEKNELLGVRLVARESTGPAKNKRRLA